MVPASQDAASTIVGDAVNQAARLQVKTRDLGASILVTAGTRSELDPTDGVYLRARAVEAAASRREEAAAHPRHRLVTTISAYSPGTRMEPSVAVSKRATVASRSASSLA
jgi:hypothetical protein